MSSPRPTLAVGCLLFALTAAPLVAQDESAPDDAPPPFRSAHVDSLPWRNIGPANMAGRVTDIAVVASRPTTWYVGSAAGGLWKTTNAGTTWKALFQNERSSAVGDVAVAPSNPDVVWVGTGEEAARNSTSWGYGVYKSTDAGETFTHVGLEHTFQIGHIDIHPENSDVVFVAALGRLWGPNPARGIYRTKDGGKTWEKVLYVDDRTGAIDVRIDPNDSNIVYACLYERLRDGFDGNDPSVRFGEQSGIYRSADGGDTWERMTSGLPSCKWGRSGLTLSGSTPGTLFATIETERSGWATGTERTKETNSQRAYMGVSSRDADDGGIEVRRVTPNSPAAKAGLEAGDVISKMGETAIADRRALLAHLAEVQADDEETFTVKRGEETLEIKFTFGKRPGQSGRGAGGGGNSGGPLAGRLGGQRANVQEEQGEQGFETGGVFKSDDYGVTWTRLNSLTDRPFYYSVIAVDPSNDDHLYSCGVPFYASFDGGKSFEEVHRGIHVDFHAIWVDPNDSDHVIAGCDGGVHVSFDRCATWQMVNNFVIGQFYNCAVDNSIPYNVYGGLQDNGTWGGPSRTRFREGITADDWVTIWGGDGFRAKVDPDEPHVVFATSQNGGMGRVDMRLGRSTGRVNKPRGRWNWNTPFFLSPHNDEILYFAGDKACRSIDRGANSVALSDTLGLTDRGTATQFAESPRTAGILYVGTDDGAVWRSRDGGAEWTEIHGKVLGLPGPRYVSALVPSNHSDDRIYAAFDGHRSDDLETHVFVSEDGGDTWTSLANGVAGEPVRAFAEDPRNENLLFLGTEHGCYTSLDRGTTWFPLGAEFPTVPVHEFAIQNRDSELVAATHGRGLWVLDIEPLRQLSAEVAAKPAHLFRPQTAMLFRMRSKVMLGHRDWRAANPPNGAVIYLWLADEPEDTPTVTIHDVAGETLATLTSRKRAGLHRFTWTAMRSFRGRRGGDGPRNTGPAPGDYAVRFEVSDDETLVQPLRIVDDPGGMHSPFDVSTPAGSQERRN